MSVRLHILFIRIDFIVRRRRRITPPDHNLILFVPNLIMSAAFTFRAIAKSRQEESNRMRFKKFNKTKKVNTFSFENINLENEKDDEEVFEDATDGEVGDKYITDTRISVDVRGQIFKVSRDTLQEMVFFRNIIESDENISSIYIDRSPKSFSHLLDFMTYEVMDPSIDNFTKKQILIDMDYFGISGSGSMTSIGDEKEKMVDKKLTPICIGGYSTLGIDDETINELDDLVEKNQPYIGHENPKRHYYHKGGRCCLDACLNGVKFHPHINSDGHMDRCVILKTESATRGTTYGCSIHRERMYGTD